MSTSGTTGSGSADKPKAGRRRSLEQMKSDTKSEQQRENDRSDQLRNKNVDTSTEKVKKRNPKRENPNFEAPKISLDQWTTEWIEGPRANIEVKMRWDVEQEIVREHAKQLEYDVNVLQFASRDARKKVRAAYESVSTAQLAYRLLLTLPRSTQGPIQDLINGLKTMDQPRNTPVYAEMLSHIGKGRTDNFGNIRIDGQLLLARRYLIKAAFHVKDLSPWKEELRLAHGDWDDIANYANGIWNDSDSLSWLRKRAIEEYESMREQNYDRTDPSKPPEKQPRVSLPYIRISDYEPDGTPFRLTPEQIVEYNSWIADFAGDTQHRVMAALIILMIGQDFFRTTSERLDKFYPDLKQEGFNYADKTMSQLLHYLEVPRLSDYLDDRCLLDNYAVINDTYRMIAEQRVGHMFKLVPISKDEFGTEAQVMTTIDDNWATNPFVETKFKMTNMQKIAAAGIFRYAERVRHHVSDSMIFKAPRRAIVSELVNRFSKK